MMSGGFANPTLLFRMRWGGWRCFGILTGFFLFFEGLGQCPQPEMIRLRYDSLMTLDNNQQAVGFPALVRICDRCQLNRDSTYAKIWHRLGTLAYLKKDYPTAIDYTRRAIRLNSQKRTDVSPSFLAKSYFNLGNIYLDQQDFRTARLIFQQFVTMGSRYPERYELVGLAYWHLANLFFKESDYQKGIRQAELGVSYAERIGNAELMAANLTEKANCLKEIGDYEQALQIVNQIILLFGTLPEPSIRLANAYSSQASVLGHLHRFGEALKAYEKAYAVHVQIQNPAGQSEVTSNIGFLYDNYLHQYDKALIHYRKALETIGDTRYGRVRILSNIGEIYWRKKHYPTALRFFQTALDTLHFDDRQKPAELTRTIRLTPYKEYLLTVIQNKADTWLDYAKSRPEPTRNLLREALKRYQIADQMIDIMRFEQAGQQSKLYWRQKTHSMYERAIETAYRLKDSEMAFHFFEKSRAVLLSDKLNELGARQELPPLQAQQEQDFRQRINTMQNALSELKPGSRSYDSTRTVLMTEQEKLDAFLKKLEQENPTYYRYKFDNTVPSLARLQNWLSDRKSTLVTYFVGDSAFYSLAVGASGTRLVRQSVQDYQKVVGEFLPLCATDRQNRQFGRFLTLSHQVYNQLLKPLNLTTERVIISPDYHFIPFETLSKSANQPDFLLKHHAFSYGYSATVLLKETERPSSKSSEFLGMAPVHFNQALQQATLAGSSQVLANIGDRFSHPTVLTDQAATRRAFRTLAPNYRVVQLFTHAEADSVGHEPLLYFADSTLRLSELSDAGPYQTQLIVLSACKTSLGVNQQGEGIFSLARGFATLGIPSVLTTLWSVEDQATYKLTERFYHHLSEGLPKDQALQLAKLDWLASASRADQLPYRWAGLILVGNADPLSDFQTAWWWLGGGFVVILALVMSRRFRQRTRKPKSVY
ncbi:CHAT domain-containing protein [Larkinella humicola]|uniref:CHAT domain-containing protein n=1 Tax=Larkinella humicola TaxID=2607654 RepID=A0A5N1JS76_9BACT|nr:CHAT domain-containing protein [Larkinella humicola]KAA9356663.1 CHAT domain-containing protein [Larkinella humicola]